MVTKWWKNTVKFMMTYDGTPNGLVLCKDLYDNNVYFSHVYYPHYIYSSFELSDTSIGISVGDDDTAEDEEDYNLKNTITSGLTGNVTSVSGVDSNNKPYITFNVVLSNTTSSNIVVREIGLKQYGEFTDSPGSQAYSSTYGYLIDRTVLATPITVPAHDHASIRYTITTDINFAS